MNMEKKREKQESATDLFLGNYGFGGKAHVPLPNEPTSPLELTLQVITQTMANLQKTMGSMELKMERTHQSVLQSLSEQQLRMQSLEMRMGTIEKKLNIATGNADSFSTLEGSMTFDNEKALDPGVCDAISSSEPMQWAKTDSQSPQDDFPSPQSPASPQSETHRSPVNDKKKRGGENHSRKQRFIKEVAFGRSLTNTIPPGRIQRFQKHDDDDNYNNHHKSIMKGAKKKESKKHLMGDK